MNMKFFHRTSKKNFKNFKIYCSVVVVVALVGRELYESSKTKKPDCPICTHHILKRRRFDDGSEWENGRCANVTNSSAADEIMYGFEYTVKLKENATCCSLMMQRYEDPIIIWVRPFK